MWYLENLIRAYSKAKYFLKIMETSSEEDEKGSRCGEGSSKYHIQDTWRPEAYKTPKTMISMQEVLSSEMIKLLAHLIRKKHLLWHSQENWMIMHAISRNLSDCALSTSTLKKSVDYQKGPLEKKIPCDILCNKKWLSGTLADKSFVNFQLMYLEWT